MSNIRQIANDLFIVEEEMRPGWFFSVVVVFGENKIGVIDTGFEETPENSVFPLIVEQGRRLDEVDLVVNTHRDGDHIRGNSSFKEKTNALIAIHKMEVEAVPNVDIQLDDGSQVELGDRIFSVIHTPGHRPGSICLYDSKEKVLITGDSVCGTREDLIRMDKNIYIDSLQNLMQYDVETMIMSHPFEPPSKNVLFGDEIMEFIKDSIEIAENL
jgi:glyoxylase-like metal-dependent hydrolase (beta-lactamase superfamily II)